MSPLIADEIEPLLKHYSVTHGGLSFPGEKLDLAEPGTLMYLVNELANEYRKVGWTVKLVDHFYTSVSDWGLEFS